jgi:hypothetical protein
VGQKSVIRGICPSSSRSKKAHSRVAVTGIRELDPARRVGAFPDDSLDVEMPVAGEALNVEDEQLLRRTPHCLL